MIREESEDFFSVTRAIDYRIVHTWRIENFEKYFSSKFHLSSVHSQVFCHNEDPSTKWSLQFFPKGDKDSNSQSTGGPDMVSFFINLDKSSETIELPAKYSAVIIGREFNGDGIHRSPLPTITPRIHYLILGKEKVVPKVTGSNTFKRGSGWGRSKFMKLEELIKDRNLYLIDDSLTLRVTIEYVKHVTAIQKKRNNSIVSSGTTGVSSDTLSSTSINSPIREVTRVASKRPNVDPSRTLRSAMDWYDVTFSVSGVQIHAHKWIVSSGCPALAELIQQSTDSLVIVDGAEPAAFAEMIRFIYTGYCDLPNFGCKLMAVTHRFRFNALQLKCEEYLISTLDKTNCFMFYSLGDMCCSSRLKTASARMIETLGISCFSNTLSSTLMT